MVHSYCSSVNMLPLIDASIFNGLLLITVEPSSNSSPEHSFLAMLESFSQGWLSFEDCGLKGKKGIFNRLTHRTLWIEFDCIFAQRIFL